MTKILSSLPRQEALFVGEAASMPARIRLNSLKDDMLPDSNDISFSKAWNGLGLSNEELAIVVQKMV